MKYIRLNNGIDIPVLGYGSYKNKGSECVSVIADAIECGYRLIDTAKIYHNEKEVGEGIKASGIDRSEIFLTTKLWFKDYENGYENACEALRILNTDYIDLMLLHWPFGNYYKAWRDLERFYKEGKCRAIGVSNFTPSMLVDLISYNEIKPVINQVETNLFCQRVTEHFWFEKYNVVHEAYRPLYRKEEYFNDPIIKTLCEKYGKTPTQITLNFLCSMNIVSIPKTSHKERMIENLDVFDFNLTQNEISLLKSLNREEPTCGFPEKPWKVEEALNW